MRHLREGRKLNRTSSHRKALLNNLATSLFQYKKIETTEARAKELRPFAERLITKAKHALLREKQGSLPDGQTIDIHNRRIVGKRITNKAVLQELFDTIAPIVESRNGGYTRIIKTGARRGDGGDKAMIELVDWSAPQDGASSLKKKKKAVKAKRKKPIAKAVPAIESDAKVQSVITDEKKESVPQQTDALSSNPDLSIEDSGSQDNVANNEENQNSDTQTK